MINKLISKFIYKLKFIFVNSSLINTSGKIGEKLITSDVNIIGDINIGDYVKITGGVRISGKVDIGNNTVLNGPNTDIFSFINRVTIGRFCSIARNVSIQEFNHKFDQLTSSFICSNVFKENIENDISSNGTIEIGNDVWIGTQCVILSGSKIGDGAIVAANSVVNGVVPPYSIVGGSPAKVIKYRFTNEIIEKLKEIKWWNWSEKKIKLNKNIFKEKLDIKTLSLINHKE